MHRELRAYLTDAEGESDLVVVVFLDVRGFSSFAGMAESSEAALFLRRMYIRVLDDYFPDAAFFKPTGDGLMIIRHVETTTLHEVVMNSIRKSLELVDAFPTISAEDPMVNFDVPDGLGVGISRGAATRLASGDHTLDYSGRPLNLAARLMDLARPKGVVVDGRVLKGLTLDADLQAQLAPESVYVKGIADTKAIDVFRSDGVSIRSANRRPLVGEPYVQELETLTFRKFSTLGRFLHDIQLEPMDPDEVALEIGIPVVGENGRLVPEMVTFKTLKPVHVRPGPDGWEVGYDYSSAIATCEERGVKQTWSITRRLRYSVAEVPAQGGASVPDDEAVS